MKPIEDEHPYIFLDGVYLKRSWGGEVHESSVLVAIGVNSEGYREILGVAEGSREDKALIIGYAASCTIVCEGKNFALNFLYLLFKEFLCLIK